jgi:hypothetical protein
MKEDWEIIRQIDALEMDIKRVPKEHCYHYECVGGVQMLKWALGDEI